MDLLCLSHESTEWLHFGGVGDARLLNRRIHVDIGWLGKSELLGNLYHLPCDKLSTLFAETVSKVFDAGTIQTFRRFQ